MLKKVGEFYDQEVEATVNNLTALLEPMLTVFMGVMVGAMVISPVPADVRLHQAGPDRRELIRSGLRIHARNRSNVLRR